MYLVMDTTGAAFSLTLDGAPLYDAASAQQSSATVTLPLAAARAWRSRSVPAES